MIKAKFYICVIVTCLGFNGPFFAQQSNEDSLLSVLKTSKIDSVKLDVLNSLCEKSWLKGDYIKARQYADDALLIANAKITTSSAGEKNIFLKGKANTLNHIAIIFRYLGNYTEALTNHFAALKIREVINDKKGIARSYLGIGSIYNFMGDNAKALDYKFKSKKLYEELKDTIDLANVCNHIGLIYYEQGKYDDANSFFMQAIMNCFKTGNFSVLANSYSYAGLVYEKTGDYKQAIDNYGLCLAIKQSLGLKDGITESYLFLGLVNIKIKKYREADKYLNKALSLAKEIRSREHQKNIYLGYTKLDSVNGDFKSAFQHHKLYMAYRDSLVNQKTSEKITQLQNQFETEKREQIRVLEEKQLEIKRQAESKQQKIILYAVSSGLFLMFILAIVIFRGYQQKQKSNRELLSKNEIIEEQKRIVEEKHKEITDSIHYAQRIQRALITPEKYIEKQLNKLNKKV